MASVVLTALGANYLTPGNFLEILFAQGPAAGFSGPRPILLMGNATAAGSATADTVVYGPDTTVPLQQELDAINLFGAGSELHRMFVATVALNPSTPVYAIRVTSSGGTAASATITFTSTATSSGNYRFYFGGTFYDTGFASGDTVTTIATNFVSTINAVAILPFTAANTAGVVTLTAKIPGPRGNDIRWGGQITANAGTTVSGTIDQAFTSGATADSNTAALATINPNRYYYIVSAAADAAQFGALCTQIGLQAQPINGIRQRAFAASTDTLANAITLATGINNPRADIIWSQSSPHQPYILAAKVAAFVSLFENSGDSPRCNWAGFGNDPVTQPFWDVKASRSTSAFPTKTSIESALHNGLSPIGANANGTTYLVNLITSRSLSGSTQDLRITAHHKVTICDFFGDDWITKANLQFAGKKIANDPPQGAPPPAPDVVTPTVVRGALFGLIDQYAQNSLLENVPQTKAASIIQRSVNPTTRMEIQTPLDCIDVLLQTAHQVLQVG